MHPQVSCFVMRCNAMAVFCGLLAAIPGCGDGLNRAAVVGKVTVGDAPLASGRVLFLPEPPLEAPTVSVKVTNGRYSLDRRAGPVVGVHRVKVDADLPLGFDLDDEEAFAKRKGAPLPPDPIPPQFNRESTLTTEVKSGENVFDIAVPAAQR